MPHSAYDFFTAQAHHRRLSLFFYRLFALVVVLHAFGLLFVCLLVGFFFTGDLGLSYWLFSLFLLFVYVVLGVFVARFRLAEGGVAVAKRMGAVRLFIDQSGEHKGQALFFSTFVRAGKISDLPSSYARAYEFAEQMSLASGVAMPFLYVLPNQMGVNACVAGFDDDDTVLILSEGAVDTLSNEALYALIAHQYGAIIHGDARLNLKVNMMTTGLSWLYECAEWLETLLLGKFDADYHGKQPIRTTPLSKPLTKEDWVYYWQNQPHHRTPYSVRQYKHASYNRTTDEAVGAFALFLPVFGFLVVLRLVGLFGMASSDWIVARFNRERSFLADATSVQLTRSFGIGELLNVVRAGSSFLSGSCANHLGYFFFAPIKEQQEFFDTHPSLDERLDVLGLQAYQELGIALTRPLDKAMLDDCHSHALDHQKIIPLAQELIEHLAYTPAPADKVVDGRLVVDKDWFDWRPYDEMDKVEVGSVAVTGVVWQLSEPFLPKQLKSVQLPWALTKFERQKVGVLSLIEALCLCRFGVINKQHSLYEIYIKPYHNNVGGAMVRQFDDELLSALALTDRRCDGVLIAKAIRTLARHIHNANIPLTNNERTSLTEYQKSLICLVKTYQHQGTKTTNAKELADKLPMFYYGAVLALLIKTLSPLGESGFDDDYLFAQAGLSDFDKTQALWLLVLAFLVSVQDNSLLLKEYDKMTSALVRFGRLVGVDVAGLDKATLVSLIENTHHFGVADWAVCLLALGQTKSNPETLYTALLYDTAISQLESDLYLLLVELFQ